MKGFELSNKDVENWTATQFWEADPMNNNGNALCSICLYVDWEKKEAEVETIMNTNSTPGRIWHGLASRYKLPEDTDFTQFESFYNEDILPIIQKASEGFESEWDGSNYKGRFSEEAHDLLLDIDEKLHGAPTHDYQYSFDVLGTFGESKGELVDYLKRDGIDLLKANLDNVKVLQEIIDSIESGDVVILNMDSRDYKKELTWIQEELREE